MLDPSQSASGNLEGSGRPATLLHVAAGASKTAAIALAVGILLLSLLRHLNLIDQPYDEGNESMLGSRYQGAIQSAWIDGGFRQLGGRPILNVLPTDPPSGEVYASHPPTFSWCTHVVVKRWGLSERSLRIFPIILTALASAGLAFLLARRRGLPTAVVASLLWLALPATLIYGRVANYEPAVLFFGGAALALAPGASRGGRAWFPSIALLTVAFCFDWAGAFFLPALLVLLVAERRPGRRSLLLWGGLSLLVVTIAYLILLHWWIGSVDGVWASLSRGRENFLDWNAEGRPDFWGRQQSHIPAMFGWPAPGCALIGLVFSILRACRRQADVIDGQILAWSTVAVLNVAVFPVQAWIHDYWWYYATPVVVLAAAQLLILLSRRLPGRVLAGIILIAIVISNHVALKDRWENEYSGRAAHLEQEINRYFDPDTMIVMTDGSTSAYLYLEPRIIDFVSHFEGVQSLHTRYENDEFDVRQFVVWCRLPWLERHPGAATWFEEAGFSRLNEGQLVVFWTPKKARRGK